MFGLRLFLHALGMVIRNFPVALRLSIPAIVVGVLTAFVQLQNQSRQATQIALNGQVQIPFEAMSGGEILGTIAIIVLTVIVYLWTAVGWHRYTLLEEQPGAVAPRWHGAQILGYFGHGFLIGLVIIGVAIVLGTVVGIVGYAMGQMTQNRMAVAVMSGLLAYVPLTVIFYRLSPKLPGAALGQPLRMREAWAATRGASGSFIVLAIVSVVAQQALALPAGPLMAAAMPLGVLWLAAVNWLTLMVGVSILTTIYGAYVEKRELYA